jgi:two-component system, NtrC family, nitrogen regulation response regulator NtrX
VIDRNLPPELIGSSSAAGRLRGMVEQAAETRDHVLVLVEPGMSAEQVARAVHERGAGIGAPFVGCDCAAGPSGRLEAELFGPGQRSHNQVEYVSDTSAIARAAGGTLFLSEIEELPSSVQGRLAHLARDGEAAMGSGPSAMRLEIRFVAGAGKDLDREIRDGRFRPDLYQRFTIRLEVPALRQRPEDIPVLVQSLAAARCNGGVPEFSEEALMLLSALPWRRNLQELEQVVDRLVRDGQNGHVRLEDVLAHVQLERAPDMFKPAGSLQAARRGFERDYISAVLNRHGWRMGEAACALGLQRPNLYRKVRQLGIARFRTRS